MSIKEIGNCNSDEETEGTEIKDTDIKKVSAGMEQGVWVNQKRVPINIPIVCHIPQKLVIVMRSIEHLMIQSGMGALEFGMFISGKLTEDGKLVLSEDFFVPQQKVSGATIDFEEEPPDNKYNGVIHRHPNGCKGFSGTDAFHINRNFEFSILYVDNDIITGIINLNIGELRIQVPVRPEVMYPIFELGEDSVLSKIHKKESLMKSSSTDNPTFGDRRDVRGLLRDDPEEQGELGFGLNDGTEDEDDEPEVDNELLYMCKKCGEVQYIDPEDFPFCCEGCEEILDASEAELVSDITQLDDDAQKRVFEKMEEKK